MAPAVGLGTGASADEQNRLASEKLKASGQLIQMLAATGGFKGIDPMMQTPPSTPPTSGTHLSGTDVYRGRHSEAHHNSFLDADKAGTMNEISPSALRDFAAVSKVSPTRHVIV